MYLISVGGLKVAGLHRLIPFFKLAHAIRRQAEAADGNISVDLFRRGRVFFVVSTWHGMADMQRFARADKHGDLMRDGSALIKSTFNVHYQSDTFPTREEAFDRWSRQKP